MQLKAFQFIEEIAPVHVTVAPFPVCTLNLQHNILTKW